MSVPKSRRRESAIQFIDTAHKLKRHLNYYTNGEKFIKGNPQNKWNKVDRIYNQDLAYLRKLGNDVYKNIITANVFNPEIEEEYFERKKHLKYALANLYLIDEEEQRLIEKYVVFDKETDEPISILPNEYFYKHLAELLAEEERLIQGLLSSDNKRYHDSNNRA